MFRVFTTVAIGLCLSACTSNIPVQDLFGDTMRGLKAKPASSSGLNSTARKISSTSKSRAFAGVQSEGTGSFVSSRAPSVNKGKTIRGGAGYKLNLVNAPIATAAKNVLGDILKVNYIVDPHVSGNVSIQTGQAVTKDAIVDAFETALALNNAAIVQRKGVFQIVPSAEAVGSGAPISVPSVTPSGPGVKIQVIELRYTSAEEMKNILEPISRTGSIVRVDRTRNHLVLAGTNSELSSMREAISVFDVDWMRGMSVAVHPLTASAPDAVAQELETIFRSKNGAGKDLIKFVPNSRLNAILVITSRPQLLRRAATWVKKLDRLANSNEAQLFVYQIQNRPVKELAEVLQSVLNPNDSKNNSSNDNVAPDLQAQTVSSDSEDNGRQDNIQAISTESGSNKIKTSIVADVENNALLISTTEREYKRIEQILNQLDVLPTQVLIEAVIAEVTLNDELKFGLRWAIESGNFSLGLSDLATGLAGAAFPGFSWGFATKDVRVTLNALNSITDVNVISAPTLMALNNQKAVLQIGDQVPIVTQSSSSTIAPNAPVINSVELKDTGIILTIRPRINKSGRVMLEIDQEASSVVQTTTSGIDSPTIQQRKISTKVILNDGENIALGGLIQERNTLTRGQIPILGDIPILGNAFKNKTDTIKKTELIIFVRPRVVRNTREANKITNEFRNKLRLETAINRRRGGANSTQQNYRRLKY